MNTKIVYVIISGVNDVYFEQVWASAWSLKYFNPTAKVALLTDEETRNSIYSEDRKDALRYIDEINVVEFDGEYSNKEKSRWIKTNMRNLIDGDFLFVDADTIITGDLSEIDKLSCSIGAVLDNNCHAKEISDYFIFRTMYNDRLKSVFNVDYTPETDVFNSGVMYVKDNEEAHKFFTIWHENWKLSLSKGYVVDQLPLVKTCIDMGNPIEEMSGIYNCQIRSSIQYLSKAKILHTFSTQGHSNISPIFGSDIYDSIKKNRIITSDVQNILLGCKEAFLSPTVLMDKTWMKLRFLPANLYLQQYMNSENRYDKVTVSFLNFFARVFEFTRRHLHI